MEQLNANLAALLSKRQSFEELVPFVEKTAHQAYASMVDWFGPPVDPQRSCEIIPEHFSACAEALLLGRYLLFIDVKCAEEAKLAAHISHEMYHRVTLRRRNLRKQTWVDELLAYVASQKFLEEQGYTAEAREIEANWRRASVAVDFAVLFRARPRRVLFGLRGMVYPQEFGPMVTKVALALDMLLAWEDLGNLARVNSLEAFYEALPMEDQPWIRAVLTSQDDPKQVLLPDPCVSSEEALEEYVWLAKAYQEMRHLKAAVTVLEAVLGILPEYEFALHTLAKTLDIQDNALAAKGVYEKVLSLAPDNVRLRYNYACVLNKLGQKEQAGAQWRQVIAEDESIADAARTALRVIGESVEAEA